jgi:uridine kinase
MQSVSITINKELEFAVTPGRRVEELLREHLKDDEYLHYLTVLNHRYASLNQVINDDSEIDTERIFDHSAQRTYEAGALLVLSHALQKYLPGERLRVQHSICDGLYCELENRQEIAPQLIEQIKQAFEEIVNANITIEPFLTTRHQAIDYFTERGYLETVELLSFSTLNYITLYTVNGQKYWLPVPPVPHTGLINVFDIIPYAEGFVLRCPIEGDPEHLLNFVQDNPIYKIFHEATHWGEILGVTQIADINQMVREDKISEMIQISEALHEKKIASIADEIARSADEQRLVFVAGPSSSGKTTFTKRLYIQLRVLGYKAIMLSIDDYFKDREQLQTEQGENVDFERLDAIDLELLNGHLQKLMAGQSVIPPKYDFLTGRKTPGQQVIQPDAKSLFILEGIHGINPNLTRDIPEKYKYKIYVSALTHLNFDRLNRIPTHETRLLRRIVRDGKYRGYSAADTIRMWRKVIQGEKKYIFKYQHRADVMFNSSLVYELGALKNDAIDFLSEVPDDDISRPEAEWLLELLSYFMPIDEKEIPPTSILREFIGDSSFVY